MPKNAIDSRDFQRQLSRNLKGSILAGLLGAVLFALLIVYLLSVIGMVEHTDRVTRNAAEVQRRSIDMETGMRGFLLTGDDVFLNPYRDAATRVIDEMRRLRELVSDNPPQVDRLDRLISLQTGWNRFAQEMIDLRRSGGDAVTPIKAGRGRRASDEMRNTWKDFIDTEQTLRFQRNEEANRTGIVTVAFFVLFTLAATGLLAVFGRRQLLRLSQDYDRVLRAQTTHSETLAHQAWVRGAHNRLSAQVIGDLNASELGRKVLAFFGTETGAQVGAFFVRERQGVLRRVASYGFSREAEAVAQLLQPGEGMVGQAVQENRLMQVAPVKSEYLRVNSALGSQAPEAAVILPVESDGVVNGAVELALPKAPDEAVLELLKAAASTVGTSIAAVRYREQLQDALAETQQLNEELQVQQEELRTANEELEEQSRALRASQASLENQQAELEQTNNALSQRTEALDQRNAVLRRVQTQLQERADELQRASRYKSEFLANMSHELRTPLNSALILAKLLADNPKGNLTEEQVRFAESIYGSGNDLLALINDILDISKVEAGKLQVVLEDVPLSKVAGTLEINFRPLAGQKGLGLRFEVQPSAPATLLTDGQRVEQVLRNLLSNALKFTERGEVSLTISGTGDGGAIFEVRDTGIGIAPDQQEVIFEAFRQADGTTSRKYGGTGLGLSISRDLAELLGGTLEVRSTPGTGSTFSLTLPAEAPQTLESDDGDAGAAAPGSSSHASHASHALNSTRKPLAPPSQLSPVASSMGWQSRERGGMGTTAHPPVPPPAEPSLPAFEDDRAADPQGARRVLVIEDEPQFAHILYDLAHEMGYRCLVAHGAGDGFALAQQFLPDAILLDMRLPDAPGLGVLQRLKDDPHTRHIPVHVVSAQDNAEAAMHMGAIGYALKPTSREALMDVFRKFEQKLSQKVKNVLLVEDDALQRESVMRLIGDEDVVITAVGSGEEALALLKTRVFDCMVTDLRLPDMQGAELLKHMATEEIVSFPPVIVYTGRNLTRDEEQELLRYSRSIIIKGARSPERLLDEVTLFLHKVESDLSAERQTMLRAARGRDRVFEGRHILLVDDDVRNIFALTSALEQRGAQVEIARSGVEALAKLDTLSDIDLVLMDVMMPEMDGLEATRRLRADPRFAKLPVIAVTAKAMKDDQEQCLEAGASDYLAKPVNLDRLFSLLRVWMPKMERL